MSQSLIKVTECSEDNFTISYLSSANEGGAVSKLTILKADAKDLGEWLLIEAQTGGL